MLNFAKRAEEFSDWIIKHRRHLHAHPELSYREKETTAYIVTQLRDMGLEVTAFEDYTGCIARIRGGKPGKTMVLRADIDALPIQENSGVSYASKNSCVMHACGHDCHTAMLLGAARLLYEEREHLQGDVKLLFQAAEEAFVGSHYYVDGGYLDDGDAALGMHVWTTAPSGKVVVKDGALMASCDNFKLTIRGKKAPGEMPHEGKDALVAASAVILALQNVVSRLADPKEALVVSVGKLQAGETWDQVADMATMEGTVRCFDRQIRSLAQREICRIAEETARLYGCEAEMAYALLDASVINEDKELNELARESVRKMYGEEGLADSERASASEDFSYIMEKIPSSLFLFLGCYDEAQGCVHPVHNEKFKVNEEILAIGASVYAQVAADYLEREAGGEPR